MPTAGWFATPSAVLRQWGMPLTSRWVWARNSQDFAALQCRGLPFRIGTAYCSEQVDFAPRFQDVPMVQHFCLSSHLAGQGGPKCGRRTYSLRLHACKEPGLHFRRAQTNDMIFRRGSECVRHWPPGRLAATQPGEDVALVFQRVCRRELTFLTARITGDRQASPDMT